MNNGKLPIYPDPMRGVEQSFINQSPHELPRGLTKREYFAGLAMQAIASKENYDIDYDFIRTARKSIKLADALLKELDKKEEQ
jgi:hypothetical protein